MAVPIELPKDMRLRLMQYAGVPGVTLYYDKKLGKRRILPTAFFLALRDLHPERYEHVATEPGIADIIRKYGASDWTSMVGSLEEETEQRDLTKVSIEKENLIVELQKAIDDEAKAEVEYDKLARRSLALGLQEEAVALRGISADEHEHWTILDKMVRKLRG